MRKKFLGTIVILNISLLSSKATAISLDEINQLQPIETKEYEQDCDYEGGANETSHHLEPIYHQACEESVNENLPAIVIVKNQATEMFIKRIEKYAVTIAYKYDLYASVMLAQAILESESGNSSLSKEPFYNLFGIKGNYNSTSIVMKTQEDDGQGDLMTTEAEFRQYPSYEESLDDYARLLKDGLIGNPDFYNGTKKSMTNNYLEVTAFLTGKYATDTQYAEKLDQLIEVYQLTRYDDTHMNQTKEIRKADWIENDKETVRKRKVTEINNIRLLANIELNKRHVQRNQEQLKNAIIRISSYFIELLKFMKDHSD